MHTRSPNKPLHPNLITLIWVTCFHDPSISHRTAHQFRDGFAVTHEVRDGKLVADWEVVNTEPLMRVLIAPGR